MNAKIYWTYFVLCFGIVEFGLTPSGFAIAQCLPDKAGKCAPCPPLQGLFENNQCGDCKDDPSISFKPGPGIFAGILDNGHCGLCLAGRGLSATGNCVTCPTGPGLGKLENGRCADCASMKKGVFNGYCVSCLPGLALFENGRCGDCATLGKGIVNGYCATCAPGQAILANGSCGACAPGQGIANLRCITCAPGQGILRDGGTCGVCPNGEGIKADGRCGTCVVPGQQIVSSVLPNGHCGTCPMGHGITDGHCGACPHGQGILENGRCGACARGNGIFDREGVTPQGGEGTNQTGKCLDCRMVGQGLLADGTCGACQRGQGASANNPNCHPCQLPEGLIGFNICGGCNALWPLEFPSPRGRSGGISHQCYYDSGNCIKGELGVLSANGFFGLERAGDCNICSNDVAHAGLRADGACGICSAGEGINHNISYEHRTFTFRCMPCGDREELVDNECIFCSSIAQYDPILKRCVDCARGEIKIRNPNAGSPLKWVCGH